MRMIGKGIVWGTLPAPLYIKDGTIGIGTTGPGAKLDVRGDIRAADGNFELINYQKVYSWNFSSRPAGWYRIATSESNGGRNSATFELREHAAHSNLEFRVGASYGDLSGISVTVLNHNIFSSATFQKIRVLTKTTYDPMYIEVYVNPHKNDNQPFWVFIKDNLRTGWTLNNFDPGSIPPGYSSTEYDVDEVFVVARNGDSESFRVDRAGKVGIGTAGPNSTLHNAGSLALPIKTVTAAYTAADTDHTILADATAAAFTISLPTAVGIAGRIYVVKKVDSSLNAVTIDPAGTETIDGAATLSLSSQWQRAIIQSDGANWQRID